MVIAAEAVSFGLAALVAVIVAVVVLLTFGAVNKPPDVTVPALAFHVTAVLLVPVTKATNDTCWPEVIEAELGVSEMVMGDPSAAAAIPCSIKQTAISVINRKRSAKPACFCKPLQKSGVADLTCIL